MQGYGTPTATSVFSPWHASGSSSEMCQICTYEQFQEQEDHQGLLQIAIDIAFSFFFQVV